MRIAVLGINFYPEPIGIAVYTTELCEYLTNIGHEVTVFTAFPYYPQWQILKHYKKRLFMAENYKGMKIKRSYVYVPCKVTAKSRILHELSFIISSFLNMLFSTKSDVVIAISPPLGLGLTAYINSKIKKSLFVFHIQDLQPDAAVELGMIKNKILIKLLYKIEKFILTRVTSVSVISKKMEEKIVSKGVNSKKVFYFPNWVDPEYFKPSPKMNRFRVENNLGDKFIVLYSGNIGIKQGLDVILKAADKTKDNKDIVYLTVGDGAYKEGLFKKYEKMKLENIFFLPVQSKEMLPYMLSAADVCLIPQQKRITDVIMPSKLLAIMACGRPVIAGTMVGSELYDVINDSGCGVAVEPENPTQLVNAMTMIYGNRKKGVDYGKRGREYAIQHFSKETVLGLFESKIQNLLQDRLRMCIKSSLSGNDC